MRLETNGQIYDGPEGAKNFLDRYQKLANKTNRNRPQHPAVRFVRDLNRQLVNIKNRSMREYEDLIEERDLSSSKETPIEGR